MFPTLSPLAYLKMGMIVLILGILAFAGYRIYAHGKDAGRAEVTEAWERERVAQRAAYAAAEAKARKKEDADRKVAEEVENGLREQVATADAAARDLARRLRDTTARASHGPVPGGSAPPGQPAGAGGEPGDGEAIERATEDHFGACARDAERLNAWDQWATGVGL